MEVNVISTVKNRSEHFLKTFPFLVSQYGTPYNLIFVNYYDDQFEDILSHECEFRRDSFSPYLQHIKQVKLLKNLPFNVRKARNLGASHCSHKPSILCFSDIDTFIGMTYINHWSSKVSKGSSFVVTRAQDSRAALPRRISPEINYGNFLVNSQDFHQINGFDENKDYYGGDDDDVFHRLKLLGLREINPHNAVEARQYSIIHGEEMRMQERCSNPEEEYKNIFSVSDYHVNNSDFLNGRMSSIVEEHILYEQ